LCNQTLKVFAAYPTFLLPEDPPHKFSFGLQKKPLGSFARGCREWKKLHDVLDRSSQETSPLNQRNFFVKPVKRLR
jgi:hypothetical protein